MATDTIRMYEFFASLYDAKFSWSKLQHQTERKLTGSAGEQVALVLDRPLNSKLRYEIGGTWYDFPPSGVLMLEFGQSVGDEIVHFHNTKDGEDSSNDLALTLHTNHARSYRKLRMFGVVVDTKPDTAAYPGLAKVDQDIDARVALVADAIYMARRHALAQPEASTFNVFVLPEFCFRGRAGYYAPAEEARLQTELRKLVARSEWSDWLFVFGSYISGWERPDTADTSDRMINNACLVQRGGFGHSSTKWESNELCHVVTKEYKSSTDFIDIGKGLEDRDATYIDLVEQGPGKEQSHTAIDGRGIIQHGGISIGIEICLDHAKRRLKSSPQTAGDQMVDLQIITSAAMAILPPSVVAISGGWVFLCDGAPGRTELHRVEKGCAWKVPGQSYEGEAEMATNPVSPALTVPLNQQIVVAAGVNRGHQTSTGELYVKAEVSLAIYDPVELPEPQLAPTPPAS